MNAHDANAVTQMADMATLPLVRGRIRDYAMVTKPRLSSLVLMTSSLRAAARKYPRKKQA